MRSIARRIHATRGAAEQGVALIVVMGIGMVTLMLVATALTVAMSGLTKTDTDQDWNGATDAAYAAVEEYQGRLATDSSYYKYGNPAAAFSSYPISSSTVVLPATTNPAFGTGVSGTWGTLPVSQGSTHVATYRYEVDNSQYADKGTVRLRATGRVGNVTRSIVADLKQSGFIDYVYFTDYEVQDPQLTGQPSCEVHIWDGRPGDPPCTAIQFGSNDDLGGPVHSNDTLTLCGAHFGGQVTTSNPNTPIANVPNGCSAATYSVGTGPVYQAPLSMPPTNAEMKKETRNDLSLPNPGCMYTGPTVVTFTSNGKMNVKSPWTKFTNVSLTNGIPSTNPAQCGTPGTAVGQLGSSGGATIDIVNANLIYAQNVPTVTTDPNYRSGTPSSFSCVNSNAGWTFSSAQYPASGEATPVGTNSSLPAYGCRNGDVFVKGVFNGQMTVAAENYVYVTGNLTYADNTDDMLGLVGSNGVWVWNPMKSSNTTPLLTDSGRTIEAAILSVAHTFQVQNYTVGGSNRGTLTILGSIAQRFRGPVSRTSGGVVTGYGSKDYNYDARLAHVAPPKFLSPVSSVYTVTQFASVPSAFSSTGTAQ